MASGPYLETGPRYFGPTADVNPTPSTETIADTCSVSPGATQDVYVIFNESYASRYECSQKYKPKSCFTPEVTCGADFFTAYCRDGPYGDCTDFSSDHYPDGNWNTEHDSTFTNTIAGFEAYCRSWENNAGSFNGGIGDYRGTVNKGTCADADPPEGTFPGASVEGKEVAQNFGDWAFCKAVNQSMPSDPYYPAEGMLGVSQYCGSGKNLDCDGAAG